jgi:hypothetical protein
MVTEIRIGIRKPNNSPFATRGLVTSTLAGPDLCHLLPRFPYNRTARIRKIAWSNNTGFPAFLIFGTVTNVLPVAPGTFVPLFPAITAITGFDGELTEPELPDVEFYPDRTALAAGLTGDIYLMAGLAGVLVRLEVEEFA